MVDSFIWKTKKDQGLSLKDSITELYISESLKAFKSDLKEMHNVQNIIIGKAPEEAEYFTSGEFGMKF